MIKINMTNKILERHRNYLLNSKLREKILKSKELPDEIFGQQSQELKEEHIKFCEYILKELDALKTIKIETDNNTVNTYNNLFLANTQLLANIIVDINTRFKIVSETFNSDKDLDIEYSNHILKCFMYKDFSSEQEINYFQNELDFFDNINKKFILSIMDNIKQKKNIPKVNKEVFMECKESISSYIRSFLNKNHNNEIIFEIFIDIEEEMNKEITFETKDKFIQSILDFINTKLLKIKEVNIDKSLLRISEYSKWKDINRINIQEWNSYHYLFELGLKVCPYCNRQYITPIHWENGKVRADLDHFFAKNIYPYLSISIYNLVPSCKFCNSSLKNIKEFSYNDYLNPFDSGIEDVLEFSFIPKSYDSFYGKDDVDIKLNCTDDSNEELNRKALNNTKVFNIEQLYQYHSNEAKKILYKRYIYNEAYISYLIANYMNIIGNREDALELLIGDVSRDEIKNTPLGKFTSDIINELYFKNK